MAYRTFGGRERERDVVGLTAKVSMAIATPPDVLAALSFLELRLPRLPARMMTMTFASRDWGAHDCQPTPSLLTLLTFVVSYTNFIRISIGIIL